MKGPRALGPEWSKTKSNGASCLPIESRHRTINARGNATSLPVPLSRYHRCDHDLRSAESSAVTAKSMACSCPILWLEIRWSGPTTGRRLALVSDPSVQLVSKIERDLGLAPSIACTTSHLYVIERCCSHGPPQFTKPHFGIVADAQWCITTLYEDGCLV